MRGSGLTTFERGSSDLREHFPLWSVDLVRMDDEALIARIQAGDRQALEMLYRRYFDDVHAYARSIVRDSAAAAEICQDLFTAVMEKASRYEGQADTSLRRWLFTIVRNLSIDALRARGRDLSEPWNPAELTELGKDERQGSPDLAQPVTAVEHDLPALRWISDKDLAVLITRLSEPQRQALTLRYRLGLKTEEIAEIMGCTPRAVNDLEFRARRFLVERLGNLGRDAVSFRREWQRMRYRRDPVLRGRRYALTASPGVQALIEPGGVLGRRRW